MVLLAIGQVKSSTRTTMAAEQDSASHLKKTVLHGEITTGGVLCPLLLGINGQITALFGIRPGQFEQGTRLTLEGSMVKHSPCQQGTKTLRVEKILSINGDAQ